MIYLRSALAWVLMWITLLILAPLYILLCFIDPGGVHINWIPVLFLRLCAFYVGMKLRVAGVENVPLGEPVVLVSNHRSYFDIPAISLAALPTQVRFVAKRELGSIPVFGWAMRSGGHLLIARDNLEQAVRALRDFARHFRGGFSVVVFPEGTRSPGTYLLEFKRGGLHLARDLGVRIVPVSISGSQQIQPKKSLTFRPGTVLVRFHPPIDPKETRDNVLLEDRIRSAIISGLPDWTPAPEEAASAANSGCRREHSARP